MARGIHLKQLTRENLELLGLPEDPSRAVAGDAEAPAIGPQKAPGGILGGAEPVAPPRRPVGPPANPVSAPPSAETEPELDWEPLDLRALARELRSELELTLRLLGGEGAPGSTPSPE